MLCYSILCYSMLSSCRLWVRLTLEHLDPSPPRDPVPIDVDTGAELKRPAPEPAAADPLRWPAPMLLPWHNVTVATDDRERHDSGIGGGAAEWVGCRGFWRRTFWLLYILIYIYIYTYKYINIIKTHCFRRAAFPAVAKILAKMHSLWILMLNTVINTILMLNTVLILNTVINTVNIVVPKCTV